ncbi:MAG: PA14 domain-containing protein [Kiritimatiellia bacterium]|jgi:hypothetical protein
MQFINVAMLFGLLAVAIPVIIHLLNRKNHHKVLWGAMRFLLDSVRRRRRRVLLEDMLLLACRCLIPALAALAFARPFIQPESRIPWVVVLPTTLLAIAAFGTSFALWRHPRWRRGLLVASVVLFTLVLASVLFERRLNLKRFGRGAHKDVVLVVDGSSSMAMVTDGRSNFERACDEAQKYIDDAPRGTAFSIILGGPVPQVLNPVPISDKRVLRETLAQLKPVHGTLQIMGSLTASAVTLAAGNNAVKQIVVIGDGQAVGWNLSSPERWKTIQRLFAQLPTTPQVVWRTLPLPTSIRNVAVTDVSLTRPVVGADRAVGIRVTVSNTGTEAVTPDAVSVKADGVVLTSRAIRQLEPGASHTLLFHHRFAKPGASLVEAVVEAEDDLPADDVFHHVVQVVGALKVLVVDGSASPDLFGKSSTFVGLALRPELAHFQGGSTSASADFLLDPLVEPAATAAARTSFAGFGVVILADVPRLPDTAAKALAEHVASGAGLLVLPGASAVPAFYNAWALEGKPVMPLPLGRWRREHSATTGDPIDPSGFTHDALRALRTGSDLGGVRPLQFWSLDEGLAGAQHVAGRLASGAPFLAVRPFGSGTAATSAFPFDATISDLPARRSFVQLMHELVYHLARPVAADLNVAPSEGATLLLAPASAVHVGDASSNGLIGRYYKRQGFRGESLRRLDSKIDFNWGTGSPMKGIPSDRFSVIWTGSLVPPVSGDYKFNLKYDDRATLTIDGKRPSEALSLEAGQRYGVRITFEEDWSQAYIHLHWSRNGGPEEIVPPQAFSPVMAEGGEGSGEIVEIRDPAGERFHGEIFGTPNGMSLRVARSLTPGLYHVTVPSVFTEQLAGVTAADGTIVFSVASGSEESTLEALSPAQTEFLRKYISLSTATREEDVLSALHGQAFGKEVWRILAFAAFVFLVVEIALTRWIAIQRRMGEQRDVDFTNMGQAGTASFRKSLAEIRELQDD